MHADLANALPVRSRALCILLLFHDHVCGHYSLRRQKLILLQAQLTLEVRQFVSLRYPHRSTLRHELTLTLVGPAATHSDRSFT